METNQKTKQTTTGKKQKTISNDSITKEDAINSSSKAEENIDDEIDNADSTNINLDPVSKLKEAFSYGCTVKEACLHAGIKEKEYEKIILNNPELEEEFKLLKFTPALEARKSLLIGIKSTPKIAFDFIKEKFSSEFGSGINGDDENLNISSEQTEEMIRLIKNEDEFRKKLTENNGLISKESKVKEESENKNENLETSESSHRIIITDNARGYYGVECEEIDCDGNDEIESIYITE